MNSISWTPLYFPLAAKWIFLVLFRISQTSWLPHAGGPFRFDEREICFDLQYQLQKYPSEIIFR